MDNRPNGLVVSLLGPIQVTVAGEPIPINQPALRALLALLALSANRAVSASALIEGLWQEEPSRPRERNLQAHIYQLRKRLTALEPDLAPPRLTTMPPGYRLSLSQTELDLSEFTVLANQGRNAARAGDPVEAADRLGQALALWRGDALTDVTGLSDTLAAHAEVLGGQRLAVQEDRADAELAAGRHGDLIIELAALVEQHPFRERLRGQLMLALYRSGRQAEALGRYHEGRQLLRAELAVEPGAELQELYQKILRADPLLAPPEPAPSLAASSSTPRTAHPSEPEPIVPRQLPAGIRHFAGRERELARLNALLESESSNPTVLITAIGGTGGVGKTTLALHWAHSVADRFPDGQLHVNLRGYDASAGPVAPTDAIRGFLDAVGVPAAQIPASTDTQASLYRTVMADRRMLLLLDNARDAAQVRPLLPASPGSLVIVTSRSALTGLSTLDGASAVPLGLVSSDEAEAILVARLGLDRVANEAAAVTRLMELCAYLPLALAITAARAAADPAMSLATLAAEMESEQDRLDALDVGDPDISLRSVFSWSIRQLSAPAARMFRLLGVHPGPDITVPAAASMAGIARPEARRALSELINASLLSEHGPGRYAFHDLLRTYAHEQAAEVELAADQQVAIRRVLDHYLYTARGAGALIFDQDLPRPDLRTLVDPAVSPDRFQTTREAITWFAAEHQVLIAATALAESEGLDSYAWQIPCTMTEYFRATARIRDWERQNHVAFAAADRLGDPDAMGRVVFSIGTYARITGAFEDAVSQLNQSMSYFLENQDAAAQAAVHMGLSTAYISERPTLSPALVLENADAALKHANRALEIYRGSGNKTGQQFALIDLAEHHLALGQLLTAEECCTEAMELSIEVGDKSWGGDAFATMGRISYGLGRYEAAITHYLQALSTVGDFQIPIRPPSILEDLGDAYLKVGNVDAARAAWREVVEFNQKQEQARERPYWRAERARAKLEELPADQPAQATASDSAG